MDQEHGVGDTWGFPEERHSQCLCGADFVGTQAQADAKLHAHLAEFGLGWE